MAACKHAGCELEFDTERELEEHEISHLELHREVLCFECAQRVNNLRLSSQPAENLSNNCRASIRIPKLTDLVMKSDDPDLRPFVKVISIFPYIP